LFLDPIIDDLGLSRSVVSGLYTVATLLGSFSLPWIGRFIDRRGPRMAVIGIASLLALACVGMSRVQGIVTLGLGFMAIRGLGQGALGLVSIHAINLWFVRRRGLALSLSGIGFALGIAGFPLLIEALTQEFGWRWAYALLGGLVAVTILPLGGIIFRDRPERYGLKPDGLLEDSTSEDKLAAETNYTLAQARRTLTFWLFVAGNFCVASLGTGLIFHHYSIMAASGVERTVAALVFVPFGMVTAGSNLFSGLLMDRISPRLLLTVMLGVLATILLLAVRVNSSELMLLYGVLLGLMQGMNGLLQAGVYAYYFGRSHLGAISGLATTIAIGGTAFGPILFALSFDQLGSYAPVLTGVTVLPVAIALTSLVMEFKKS
ncbi:MAG: MFS transporter, partial [Kamptonema sp. SIO4C4]|nr:MFS transporter [Kamptonema sp. SIO4C4]